MKRIKPKQITAAAWMKQTVLGKSYLIIKSIFQPPNVPHLHITPPSLTGVEIEIESLWFKKQPMYSFHKQWSGYSCPEVEPHDSKAQGSDRPVRKVEFVRNLKNKE